MPSVSVVIPTYNRRASLQRLLAALAAQTCAPSEFEVIIVDDGSADGTPTYLRATAWPYSLRVFEQAHAGPAAARNRGVAEARAPLVLFLDDDVAPRPTLVAAHLAAHAAAPSMAAIGPMLPPPDWRRPAWVRWEEEKLLRQYADLRAGRYACTPRQFFTGNASLPRARFLAAGGFDERFQRAEDVELAYRLRNAGVVFAFEPRAEVLHYPTRGFAAWRRIPYQYGRYDAIMTREKGHEALTAALAEFQQRRHANRRLARLCVGRPALLWSTVQALSALVVAADRAGAWPSASAALSAIFNLLYWQGVADELGGRHAWRQAIARQRPRDHRAAASLASQ